MTTQVYQMLDGDVLVRGMLDVHEALRAWAAELGDGCLTPGLFEYIDPTDEVVSYADPENYREAVSDFGDVVHRMIASARVGTWRMVPGTAGDRENGYAWWLWESEPGRGAFPGVWFA